MSRLKSFQKMKTMRKKKQEDAGTTQLKISSTLAFHSMLTILYSRKRYLSVQMDILCKQVFMMIPPDLLTRSNLLTVVFGRASDDS
jgi:hypothetical protein